MKIELLYFDHCATWETTLADLRQALSAVGRQEQVSLVKVESQQEAERLRFLGSPTVRVNGNDVEPGIPSTGFGMECRLYWVEGRPTGSPPMQWIENAIAAAR